MVHSYSLNAFFFHLESFTNVLWFLYNFEEYLSDLKNFPDSSSLVLATNCVIWKSLKTFLTTCLRFAVYFDQQVHLATPVEMLEGSSFSSFLVSGRHRWSELLQTKATELENLPPIIWASLVLTSYNSSFYGLICSNSQVLEYFFSFLFIPLL